MKFVHFQSSDSSESQAGILEGDAIRIVEGDIFGEWSHTGDAVSLADVKLRAPFAPRHIIGIGANYIAEGEPKPKPISDIPIFFFKPTTSVIGPGEDIVVPDGTDEVKFESEIAVVIGRPMRRVSEADVYDHVFGYTVVNDVTAFDFFHPAGHWTVGKAFDTFTPLGPALETEMDPDKVKIKSFLNGELKQNSGTNLIIITIPQMLAYLSGVMTLDAGDVILTGAPVGAEMMHRATLSNV